VIILTILAGMFRKQDWYSAIRQFPTSKIVDWVVGIVLAAVGTLIASLFGIPSLDQLEWPTLTGLGYLLIFIVASFLFVAIFAFARWTGLADTLKRWRGKLDGSVLLLKVEIRDRWLDQEHQKATEEIRRKVTELNNPFFQPPGARYHSTIHILNTSKNQRLSLKLAAYVVEPGPGREPLTVFEPKANGLTLNLGPEQETEGTFTVDLPAGYTEGNHTLILVDRFSDQTVRVRVPGRFP
jgi:hypothetical protein